MKKVEREEAEKLVGRVFLCPDGIVRWITGLSVRGYYQLLWRACADDTWFSGGICKVHKWHEWYEGAEEVEAPRPGERVKRAGVFGTVEEREVQPLGHGTRVAEGEAMEVYRSEAMIDLMATEAAVFRGEAEATPELLTIKARDRRGEFEHTYKSFEERVGHVASELHYETKRTVLICDAGTGDILARYNEDGLRREGE